MLRAAAASFALARSREAIAVTVVNRPCCMAGSTFLRPILAVLRIPQRSFSDMERILARFDRCVRFEDAGFPFAFLSTRRRTCSRQPVRQRTKIRVSHDDAACELPYADIIPPFLCESHLCGSGGPWTYRTYGNAGSTCVGERKEARHARHGYELHGRYEWRGHECDGPKHGGHGMPHVRVSAAGAPAGR